MPELFIRYKCPKCYHTWHEVWESACDSDCPECGLRDIEALDWTELTEEDINKEIRRGDL